MANNKKSSSGKSMEDYRKQRERLNKGTRIIAIGMIVLMLLFTFVTTGMFLLG